MTHPNASTPAVGPRASHYVSISNGGIYPAMSSPAGHEDLNPSDWRPATPQEVQRFLQGEQEVDVSPVPLGIAPTAISEVASPTTLTLAPEPPAPPAAPIQEAPVVPPAAPVVPPIAATLAPAPLGGAIPRAPTE